MNDAKKKYSYEIREIDALSDSESGWTWNASYYIGTMETAAADVRRALTAYLKRHGIAFKPNRTIIYDDGSIIEIQDRKTKEPLFAAIPNF